MEGVIAVAFACALVAMGLYGGASVAQAWAASRASGPAVMRHPAYVAGLVADGLAWLVSLVALLRLPIFVVQSLLAGSLAVTILLAIPVLRIVPKMPDWIGVGVVTAGIVLVSLAAGPESRHVPHHALRVAIWVLLAIAVTAAVWSYRRGGPVLQGFLAGLGYGLSAVFVRIVMGVAHTPWQALARPETFAALLSGAVGVAMYARSLEHGLVGPPTAAMWVTEVVVPGVIGVAMLGDRVRPHFEVPAALGVALAIAGCIVLALSPTQEKVGSH